MDNINVRFGHLTIAKLYNWDFIVRQIDTDT